MFGLILNKVSHGINLIQFKIGEFLFPILEPFCRILENRNSEVRRHFQRALKSLERQDFNVALLNLNMAEHSEILELFSTDQFIESNNANYTAIQEVAENLGIIK